MSTKTEIQDLLRFLSKDAKLPLAQAMSKIKPLQEASLTSTISQVSITVLSPIFGSEAAAKPVLAAAKRVCKKRAGGDDGSTASSKRRRGTDDESQMSGADLERNLALPGSEASVEELERTAIVTNRAPLVLAFAAVVLERTMSWQPLSSRLSLAQAVVSLNSRSKAQSLGLEKGRSAEEEGWGMGTRKVTVLGREVSAIKRGDRDMEPDPSASTDSQATSVTIKADPIDDRHVALWGLDLEAMRAKNSAVALTRSAELPIYRPEAARAYLVKAFAPAEVSRDESEPEQKPVKKKKTKAEVEAEKEEMCGRLLSAIRLLCDSWEKLAPHELDRRAWSWYVDVRPEVANGVAGWGGKNMVKIKDILDLRRKAD